MSTSNYAQIKKEYLVDVSKCETIPITEIKTDNIDTSEPPLKKQKTNQRGQNKSRAKQNRIQYQILLCPDIAQGKICKFDNQNKPCKFSHDIQKYLKCDKPKDIGNRCIFFDALGHCPHGYRCRFGGAHIDNNGKLITKQINKDNTEEKKIDESTESVAKYPITSDMNTITTQQAKFLSKTKQNNLKPFPITKQLMQYYKQFNDLYHPTKRRNLQKKHQNDTKNMNYTKWEDDTVIQTSNNYKLENVFLFKNRKETDTKLDELFTNCPNGNSIQNYYTSLDLIDLQPRKFDIKNKLYLAPLTTVGNLPFRRICIEYGAEITCAEMAMSSNLLKGRRGEWALCRRHSSEKIFGLQLAGGYVDSVSKILEYFHHSLDFKYDFIDLNVGCPLDEINNRRCGAALMKSPYHLRTLLRGMYAITNANTSCFSKGAVPITAKMRKGYLHAEPNAKEIINVLYYDGVSAIGVHGRSRQQRYRRPADWDYIKQCVDISNGRVPIIGNGDIYNWNEWYECMEKSKCESILIGRGALVKPWLFKEIREKKCIDISSSERFDMIKRFVNYGLERWGSDQRGVDNTRKFTLEWLSFLCRYIPVGILEKPAKINHSVPVAKYFVGRNELETLFASKNVGDWITITEMLLGPVNDSNFHFVPKHKASAYAPSIIDGKNYILNDMGEVVKVNNNGNDNGVENKVLTTSVLGEKRKLNET
eukprot:293884_1